MKPEDLVSVFPVLFHMTEIECWPGIGKHGLLSTSAILDWFDVEGREREALESHQRREKVVLSHPKFGSVVIRDQKPLSEARLENCLTGMSTAEWYKLLNRKVFFWPTERRLVELLGARAYRDRGHLVLHISTTDLVDRYSSQILLSPINSGATLPIGHPRGPNTFLPLREYPYEDWRRKRGPLKAIAEVSVEYAIPDVMDLVVNIEVREFRKKPKTAF